MSLMRLLTYSLIHTLQTFIDPLSKISINPPAFAKWLPGSAINPLFNTY